MSKCIFEFDVIHANYLFETEQTDTLRVRRLA